MPTVPSICHGCTPCCSCCLFWQSVRTHSSEGLADCIPSKEIRSIGTKWRYIMKRFHMLGDAAMAISALTGSADADGLVKVTHAHRGNRDTAINHLCEKT